MTAVLNAATYKELLGAALPVVISSDREYKRLIGVVERLMDRGELALTREEGELLKLLTLLIESYEDERIPMPQTNPAKMVKTCLEEAGLPQIALVEVLGSRSRVSEILSGKRSISKEQAKRLAAFFRVPVELFL
jgi:HTH-type transcriptional regulator / antitoxin HigA